MVLTDETMYRADSAGNPGRDHRSSRGGIAIEIKKINVLEVSDVYLLVLKMGLNLIAVLIIAEYRFLMILSG